MELNKIIRSTVGADYAVSKINPDYETSLYAAFGFSDNPHLILKLHYRPWWGFRYLDVFVKNHYQVVRKARHIVDRTE